MGVSLSWASDEALVRAINLGSEIAKTTFRSVSFNGHETKSAILKAWGSSKLIIQGSLSFNKKEMETKISVTSPRSLNMPKEKAETPKKPASFRRTRFGLSSNIDIESPKHEAALKLQKVYKSFRTRRQLADCAVLVEQSWWKLLDFALLKRTSVSFFDIERPESVISKWSRAKSRAAKVGKGLSKDEKAQKLALQHWLEAIDPRHRYGHNLHFYYHCWLQCESRQPFFYWLDVGEGKEVSIDENCARLKLQHQCIKYLGPKERQVYEVIVEDGKLMYRKSMQLLDTSEGPKDTKWIFVLSTSKTLYVGQKKKGTFQHSSFLAGGATSAAGRLEVDNGVLKAVWPHSGHYRPTEENFQEFVNFLKENNIDLADVKKSPIGEEEEVLQTGLRTSRSELDLTTQSVDTSGGLATNATTLKRSRSYNMLVEPFPATSLPQSKLEVHTGAKRMHIKTKNSQETVTAIKNSTKSNMYNRSTSDVHLIFRKPNLFVEEWESESTLVPSELILRRMSSKKALKSLQLGQQLSFKWTTGAGPRIGCVRDYPSELQVRALEQVSLSPRGPGNSRFCNSPRNLNSPSSKIQEVKMRG